MAEAPNFGELIKRKAILEAELSAAVDAFMAEPSLTTFLLGEGYQLDPHAAVFGSSVARGMLANPDAKPVLKRNAVWTEIPLVRQKAVS